MSRLIVGLGSPHGDDQAGWRVVDELQRLRIGPHAARKAAHPMDLWNWCTATTSLIVCDACQGTGAPGTVRRWVWPRQTLPAISPVSTHEWPLGQVLELGLVLGNCPPEVILWTIEGEEFGPATELSASVSAMVTAVAESIRRECGHA